MSLLLHTSGLEVGHDRRAILPPVDLQVHAQQIWAVVGPNGAGKTTFVRTVLGLLPAIGGTVSQRPKAIGYVPQRTQIDAAVPARAIDLVRAGGERGWSFLNPIAMMRANPAVDRALRDTDTEALARVPWLQLSEGQKQRVLMAQALASQPDLLVLDEPTSAMDLHAERGIFALIERLRDSRGLGVLIVSHNLGLLGRYATHILFVDQDQGTVQAGPAEQVVCTDEFVLRYGTLLRAQEAP